MTSSPADPVLRLSLALALVRKERRLAAIVVALVVLLVSLWVAVEQNRPSSPFNPAELEKLSDLPLPPPAAAPMEVRTPAPYSGEISTGWVRGVRTRGVRGVPT